MSNKDTKLDLIEALKSRDIYFRQVNKVEFRTRCPFCGDSSKNLNTGHFYIRIDPEDNLPVVYNCFKCNEKGILTADTLSALEVDNVDLKSNLYTLNKTSDKVDNKNFYGEVKTVYFDYELPEPKDKKKIEYLNKRLGLTFTNEDYKNMKLITSLRDFLLLNNIKTISAPPEIIRRLEDHFIGFLSYGNSHILFRDITEKDQFRWLKYPITEESRQNRLFYVMATTIDVLSKEPITINLAEGVFDALSVCYNLGFDSPNTMNISVSGKFYERLLLFLIDLGLVGSNITINIFSDNDSEFGKKKGNESTTIGYYRKKFQNFKHLYGEINVYYNTIGKDVGVPRDEICLKRYKL